MTLMIYLKKKKKKKQLFTNKIHSLDQIKLIQSGIYLLLSQNRLKIRMKVTYWTQKLLLNDLS